MLAGGFVSLAVFSRLANISGLALLIVIVYSGFFVFKQTIAFQVKQVILFIPGFLINHIGHRGHEDFRSICVVHR